MRRPVYLTGGTTERRESPNTTAEPDRTTLLQDPLSRRHSVLTHSRRIRLTNLFRIATVSLPVAQPQGVGRPKEILFVAESFLSPPVSGNPRGRSGYRHPEPLRLPFWNNSGLNTSPLLHE
jgi:hypothetical protein